MSLDGAITNLASWAGNTMMPTMAGMFFAGAVSVVRLVCARPKPPPILGQPNTHRLCERGRICEGRCGPKERHALA